MNTGDQVRIKSTGEEGEILEVFGRQIWVRVSGQKSTQTSSRNGDAHWAPLARWWFEAEELTIIE